MLKKKSEYNIENALWIDGWMWIEELTWLAEQAARHKVIVEFGSFRGRSTRAMADNTNGKIYAVDTWDWYISGWQEFNENLADKIMIGTVLPNRMSFNRFSRECLFYLESNRSLNFDMIFLDGEHDYVSVIRDIGDAKSIMPHGLLCGHDYGAREHPQVKKAVDQMFDSAIKVVGSIWWIEL